MKSVKKYSLIFASLALLLSAACQKKDEPKNMPALIPQGSGGQTKDKNDESKNTPNLSQPNPEKKDEPKVEKLDASHAKLAPLTRDESAFLQKTFSTMFENEFRSLNIQNINESDLGILSSAKITTTENSKKSILVKLHLVSANAIATFTGELNEKQIFTLTNDQLLVQVRAACADDKCDFLIGYASLKSENNTEMLGTFIFKRVGDEHLSVKIEDSSSDQEKQNFAIIRVERNLLEGIEKNGEKIVSDLKEKIKAEKAWYSPFAFVTNLTSERTDLILKDDDQFTFDLKQLFNQASPTTKLKNFEMHFAGKIGTPVTVLNNEQNIEVTWTQLTKNFGYGIFKTDRYYSSQDPEKRIHTAYFIKWCGFEEVSVNNSVMQIEKCDYKASTEFLATKNEKGELESGSAEGGLE